MTKEAEEKKPKRHPKLEWEGAEFLVLGQLLIRGIPASKAYTNQRGNDLVVFSPETNKSATTKVKSRLSKDAYHFNLGELKSDFLVLVGLNRESVDEVELTDEPDYYVLPIKIVLGLACDADRKAPYFKWDHEGFKTYRNQWELIRSFLAAHKRTQRKST